MKSVWIVFGEGSTFGSEAPMRAAFSTEAKAKAWSSGWSSGRPMLTSIREFPVDEFDRADPPNLVEARRLLDAAARHQPPYGEMCRDPKACANKGYCPRDPTCGD